MGVNRRDDALRRLELVDDEPTVAPAPGAGPDAAAPGVTAPGVTASGPARPGRARRRTLVVLAGAGVVAVAFVGSSLWQASSQRHALVGSVGGVSTLATPPEPVWEADVSGPGVWLLGDVLAVPDERGLSGLALGDGSRLWSTDLGSAPRCGPDDDAPDTAADRLVCVTGPATDPHAWVVDGDGQVVGDAALDGTLGQALPAPDEGVLRWDRSGGVVTIALQDASDGSLRWTATVEPDDLPRDDLCRPQMSGTAAADVEHGLLVVRGCRVSAVLTPDGTRVDDVGDPVTVQVLPTQAGTFLRTTALSAAGQVEVTEVVDEDGRVERVLPGRPLVPLASDGTAQPTRLLSVPSGVQSLDTAGNERWTFSGTVAQVVAVAAGSAVLDLGYVLVGVDLASGRQTWSWARDDLGTTDTVVAAFTDGTVVAVVIAPSDATAVSRVVALDLEDGSVVWDEARRVDGSGYRALGGRLFHVDPAGRLLVAHR